MSNCTHKRGYGEDGVCLDCGWTQTDEIERLREENADLRSRLAEWVNLGNQFLVGNAVDNMVKADKDAVYSPEMVDPPDRRGIRYGR